MYIVLAVLLLFAGIYVLGAGYLYVNQVRFLYHPMLQTQQRYSNMALLNEGQFRVDMIKNRGHTDISSDERYYKIMQDFIGER